MTKQKIRSGLFSEVNDPTNYFVIYQNILFYIKNLDKFKNIC
jgi:hypothetical protein